MLSIDYISGVVAKLTQKCGSRNPYDICDDLGIRIRHKDLGMYMKAFYFYQSRIRSIVLNNRISENVQRILVAHELGHDRLHKKIAMMKGFQEVELFDKTNPTEFEANIFAAELLIEDDVLLTKLNEVDSSFFSIAQELCVPAPLLDFKFRVMKRKGYGFEAPVVSHGDFLKKDIAGCFEDEY